MEILTIRNKQTLDVTTCVKIPLEDFKRKYRENSSWDVTYIMFNSDQFICDSCGIMIKYELDDDGIEQPIDVFMLYDNKHSICKYCFNLKYEVFRQK